MSRATSAPRRVRALLIAAASIALATGATAQPEHHRSPDVRAAIERSTAGLDVSAAQRAELDRIGARYADSDEPGIMWRVADELRTVLTPAQIEQLQQRPRADWRRRGGEARMGRRGEHRATDGSGRMRRERRTPRSDARDGERRMQRMDRGVAEQHREAARALAERHREQMRSLRAQRESGSLDAEEFAERARALREQMRSDIQPLLTEEARRMRAEMTEMRERMRAMRDDVLRLNAEQRAALEGRTGRGRERGDADPLSVLSAEQRATMTIYRALVRGAHGRDDSRPRLMDR